jgi:hypothetical protein
MSVICDIDNTLIRNGIFPIQSAIDFINKQPDVILITGRLESERARTIATLRKYGVRYSRLLMNNAGSSPDLQYQSKQYNAQQVVRSSHVTAAYDDNPKTQMLYRKLGIPISQSIGANTMAFPKKGGVPPQFAAAASRKIAAKKSGKGKPVIDWKHGGTPADPDGIPGNADDNLPAKSSSPVGKKGGGMNAGLKAYLASHGKKGN